MHNINEHCVGNRLPVSSAETISQIHLRVTRSMIVITAVFGQRLKCVVS